jgi:hypothetical protein
MWLWYDKDYLSFDLGYREHRHERFVDERQFAGAARGLSEQAGELVRGYRRQFADLDSVARHLATGTANGRVWDAYHAGIAAGLVGDVEAARHRFAIVREIKDDAPFMVELRRLSSGLSALVSERDAFRQRVVETVVSCRRSLKLEPREVTLA